VEWAVASEKTPKGWPAALVVFHLGMWRERLRNALSDTADGKEFTHPSENVDELNDAELPQGIGTPLADVAARADHLMGELIDLYERLGDQPFKWYTSTSTTEAVLRNSYTHPRLHLAEYWKENGDLDRAAQLWEVGVTDLRAADAPPRLVANALYNLACARARQGAADDALQLLAEALPVSEILKAAAPQDADLESLYDNPRFQELVKS
jgi:hypothetical protein